jgi:O-acetylhomoserine/O-acetylserine sulfhydrylase-like pyridoxal-dependent enzyme
VHVGKVQAGETVAIFGCGGVGLAAIMIAKSRGATVVGIDTSNPARDRARLAGADYVLDSIHDDVVKEIKKYSPAGSGSVLSFELKGGVEAGKKFVESLKLFSHVANIGDVRSLVIHPATTTHSQLSPQEQLDAGVTPGLVRLSIGLENIADIKADLEVGFAAAKG